MWTIISVFGGITCGFGGYCLGIGLFALRPIVTVPTKKPLFTDALVVVFLLGYPGGLATWLWVPYFFGTCGMVSSALTLLALLTWHFWRAIMPADEDRM